MKKIITFLSTLLAAGFLLVACSSPKQETTTSQTSSTTTEPKVIKVASHTSPMTDLLELVSDDLKQDGYTLELVKVSDNVQANIALANKEVDANFFQHKLFMEQFNKGNGANLVAVQPIYNAIVAFYSKNYKTVEEIPANATVAIPSDATNKTRALRLLAQGNLITLKDPNSYQVTLDDIAENPKNLQFQEIGLLELSKAYEEVDLAFNYPAYAAKIGLTPSENGVLLENPVDATFAISVVAREDNKDDASIAALKKALTNQKVKEFIETKLKGHAVVSFE